MSVQSALKEPLENPVQMEGSFMVLAEILHMEVLTLHPANGKICAVHAISQQAHTRTLNSEQRV